MATRLEHSESLVRTARSMVAPGKGILAADESTGTMTKRLSSIGVESTESNRRDYRELLLRAEGMSRYISGVILFDETVRQSGADGTPLVEALQRQGVIPGIKVDRGAKPLPGCPGETVTEGLDGLGERLEEYRRLGARFTKWRGVIRIGEEMPSRTCIEANAHALARYAAQSQEAGLVPIVEPEVLMDGAHDLERCFTATAATLREVFYQLGHQRVLLEGMVLKPNMVISGADAVNRAGADHVAMATVECFLRTVPAAVPGIAFLSGGQGDDEATLNLDAINRHAARVGAPWELTFSFGRGLQAAPLQAWQGRQENAGATRNVFLDRARVISEARQGRYAPGN
ncbi:MAG: fructose-bisphosphate aldolase class I [Gemmatimonadales bacterium]|nr:MAG: fructose-bisphosphate aldolase class I [Gemmatimonadales bacterium]